MISTLRTRCHNLNKSAPGHPDRSIGSQRVHFLGALVALGLTVGSCAYSTSPGLLPPHLKTVSIPVFENATTEYTLEQEVTNAVIQRFVEDNHLRVVDSRSASASITGRVVDYRNSVFGISADQSLAQEYRVSITVDVTFKDLVKNREVWHDSYLVKTANYYVQDVPGQTAKTELDGRKEAIAKIADEILSRTIETW